MSDFSQGPGWWQASDGKWYPPEQAPGGAPGGGPAGMGVPPGAVPGGMAAQGQLAEWPVRAASYAIDFIALSVIANVFSQVSSALGSILSLVAFGFGLYNAYLNGSTGQSIGKRIMGTKVVSETTGDVIGGGMGIVRYFAHILDTLICCVGWFFPIWDAKKQTIADKVMKTVVITGLPKKSLGEAFSND